MTAGQGTKPSPLAGEGGGQRPPGEGEAAHTTRLNRARGLRSAMTDAEHALWRILRNRQFAGSKFRRQVPVGPYIADFLCFEARLVIEADGGQHSDSRADMARDAWFAAQGFRVLRFWNNDILRNPEGVAYSIAATLSVRPQTETPLTPPLCGNPLPQGERVPISSRPCAERPLTRPLRGHPLPQGERVSAPSQGAASRSDTL
jgi:very-short-patch-repair endonuclease